jgi:predicted neuraminidase
MKIIWSDPIFLPASQPFQQCHASSILELEPGHLIAAWFGGTEEGHLDVSIWLSHFKNGNWAAPVSIAQVAKTPLWNPVLFKDPHDCIWLFYKVGQTIPEWTGASIRSFDHGYTWTLPTCLPAGLLGPAKNKPILLSNGDILCPTSAETWRSWTCWVEISPDGGRSWKRYGPIAFPTQMDEISNEPIGLNSQVGTADYSGVIQPTVWEYSPGCLKMLMRARQKIGFICESYSTDYGRTWTAPSPTGLFNPNSGIDAVRMADGRIALAYNPSRTERSPLAVAISEDNGLTWPDQVTLEARPGEYSYPAIIQASDSNLHITYTHQRTAIQHVILAT